MVRWMQRSDSPWCLAVFAAVAYGLFVLVRLASFSGDPSVFVVAGDALTDRGVAGAHLRVLSSSSGFDGQFFYRLALEPWSAERVAYGITLDTPAYRQQRILFPFLAWLASGGRPEHTARALVLVNWSGIILIAWWAGRLAQTADRHALAGVLLAAYPGFLYTLSRDLSEIVELAAVLAALTLLRLRRPALATVALTLALLTRETALLVAAGVLCVAVAQRVSSRHGGRVPIWAGAVPIAIWAVWQTLLLARWGVIPCLAAANNLGWPLVAVGQRVAAWVVTAEPYARLRLEMVAYLAAMALAAACSLRRSGARPHEKLAWVLYGVLAVVVSRDVWEEDWGFMRATAELSVLSGVIVLGAPPPWLARVAVVATLATWWTVARDLATRL